MPLTLLLVRHGQTPYNAENRYQGQRDVPLSETGRVQAVRLGARLGAACAAHGGPWAHSRFPGRPVAVYASDLRRASETAALIVAEMSAADPKGTPPPVHLLPALRERDFGAWEGLTIGEIRARFAGETEPREAEPWAVVWDRMNGALAAIQKSHPPPNAVVLVVGHGGSLRAFLCHALGVGRDHVRRFCLDNASLSIIELGNAFVENGESRVLVLNDTSHLFFACGPAALSGAL